MYVEDYIDILAGKVPCDHCGQFDPVKLANYDYSPVRNISRIVEDDKGLTDRQRELSVKIVSTYRRQFAKHGYDCTHVVDNPQWRSTLRVVDRTKLVCIEDDTIKIKFPFQPSMVDYFRSMQQTYGEETPWVGQAEWNKQQKYWTVPCTEYNILQVYDITQDKQFEYCKEFKKLLHTIKEIKYRNCEIGCYIDDNKVQIKNASEDLQNAFELNKTGDMLHDIGLAKRLGVDRFSLSALRHLYHQNPLLLHLATHRVIYFKKSSTLGILERLIDQLGLTPIGGNSNEENAKCVFFTDTIYGIKTKYLEKRVPLVLYCTQYAPYGQEAFCLEGY